MTTFDLSTPLGAPIVVKGAYFDGQKCVHTETLGTYAGRSGLTHVFYRDESGRRKIASRENVRPA